MSATPLQSALQSAKHSAPGQYLGYALQPVRMFFHLLSANDATSVSLEHLDDVAVHYNDGSILVEQSKSAFTKNPLSDWSIDLWKTIANWLEAVRSGVLDLEKTKFQIYVTPANKGMLSSALHASVTPDQVSALTRKIRQGLATKKNTEPKCLEHLRAFLDATDAERYELVQRLAIVSNDDDPIDAIRGLLAPAIPPHLIDVISQAGIGMAKERADRCIRNGKAAIVEISEFRAAFHAFVQKNNIPGYLTSVALPPDASTLQKVLTGKPDFVRQLEFIEATDEQLFRAVSDFLRTSADKAFWAESGQVFEGSFDEWEDTLIRRHAAVESEVHDLLSEKSETIRGRTIYNRCSLLELGLDGRAVPGHFAHGSYNSLADDRLLGWHPRYIELFGKGED